MAATAGRLTKRLGAVEARHAARRQRIAAEPPFDPTRLTAAERAELDALGSRVAWHAGEPDFSALPDAAFFRLAALIEQAHGLETRG